MYFQKERKLFFFLIVFSTYLFIVLLKFHVLALTGCGIQKMCFFHVFPLCLIVVLPKVYRVVTHWMHN
jgi:hypothetical protein